MQVISSVSLTRVFFLLEIPSAHLERNLPLRDPDLRAGAFRTCASDRYHEEKTVCKGINQIAQEGAIQIFQEFNTGMEEIIVGVVGILQFDVLKYRLENEYNVDIRLETLPYEHIRWIANKETVKVDKIVGTSDMKKVTDLKGNPLLLFVNAWSVGMVEDRNPDLVLTEFSK